MMRDFDTVVADVLTLCGESPHALTSLPDGEKWVGLDPAEQVRLLLPQTAAEIIMACEEPPCDAAVPFTAQTRSEGSGCGSIPLPADFLRLAAFRMPDWPRAVLTPDSPLSLRGSLAGGAPTELPRLFTPDHPLVLVRPSSGGLRLFYYGTASPEAAPSESLYVPRPAWSSYNTISIPESIYVQTLRATAALVAD